MKMADGSLALIECRYSRNAYQSSMFHEVLLYMGVFLSQYNYKNVNMIITLAMPPVAV